MWLSRTVCGNLHLQTWYSSWNILVCHLHLGLPTRSLQIWRLGMNLELTKISLVWDFSEMGVGYKLNSQNFTDICVRHGHQHIWRKSEIDYLIWSVLINILCGWRPKSLLNFWWFLPKTGNLATLFVAKSSIILETKVCISHEVIHYPLPSFYIILLCLEDLSTK